MPEQSKIPVNWWHVLELETTLLWSEAFVDILIQEGQESTQKRETIDDRTKQQSESGNYRHS
jgi:hypothetical protein